MLIARRPHRIARRALIAAAGSLLAAPAVVRAQGQTGVALVIGNSKYKWESSLPNVKRDATDVAKRFQSLGLKTELVQDVGRDAMRAAVDKFGSAARGANLAAFYFAGHGASWDKDTYLVSEDADLANPGTVKTLLPVTAVRDAMKDAGNRLLVFDNCRNNPADGWRQREAVISSSVASSQLAVAASLHGLNTLVLFSTAPGRIAVDGPAGDNSPFAAAFLRQLAQPSADLQALPAKLRRDLLIATEGRQVLWDQSTLDKPLPLGPPGRSSGASTTSAAPAGMASRIVELDKAYAFAREKGLLLPPGLVALRVPPNSAHASMIGSFQTTLKVPVGNGAAYNSFAQPFLLIVVSVSDGNSAEIIFAFKNWNDTGGLAQGSVWRYSTAALSDARLKFSVHGASNNVGLAQRPVEFKWADANSGWHSSETLGGAVSSRAPFSRLDG
jgi:hypothetical protein